MDWTRISEQLRIAKLDKANYATLYSTNGSSNKMGPGYDLYVRKGVECQRRYQRLITELVNRATDSATAGGDGSSAAFDISGSGRKRSASGSGGSGGNTSSSSSSSNKEMSKGPWSAEEDQKVVDLVAKYGPKKWSQIATELPGE